jgi:hypothetical protein
MKNKSLFAITFLLLVLSGTSAWAATITATSASREHVAQAIDSAYYGDTVLIPACNPGDCVWNKGITITKNIVIIGAGIGITNIVNNTTPPGGGVYSFVFEIKPDATAKTNTQQLSDKGIFSITGISFLSTSVVTYRAHITLDSYTPPIVKRVAIGNCYFANTSMSINSKGLLYGVVYSCIFYNARGPKMEGAGVSSFNDLMMPGDGKGWYIEDNRYYTFNGSACVMASGTNSGTSLIVRYNTATGNANGGVGAIESHGNQSGIVGPQVTEIYGNSINVIQYNLLHDARGGKNIVFFNKHRADDANDIRVREEYADFVSQDVPNACPLVEGQVQLCTDSCVCQKVHSSYFFINRHYTTNNLIGVDFGYDYSCLEAVPECVKVYGADTGQYPVVNNPPQLVENREYWQYRTDFDGTVGMGAGPLASRPSTCTKGTGYWATNQSCTNLTGMVGANPSTPISGTLYKCTSTDTWTAYYTPYTYPHPLRGENTQQTFSLATGWNWISFNVLPADLSLDSIFSGILDKIEQVKAQTQSAIRSTGAWKGDLADMSGIGLNKMYKVKVSTACILTVSGTAITPTTPILLTAGWNWVAYLPSTSMPIATALDSIKGQVLQVKSLTQSATYNGTSWSGTLTQLEPGQGYAIKMSGPRTLIYPGGQ